MNSNTTPLHYNFVRNILNRYQNISYDSGLAQFNTETYFRNRRNYLVGSVVAYDNLAAKVSKPMRFERRTAPLFCANGQI
jgi:hypothetical protein